MSNEVLRERYLRGEIGLREFLTAILDSEEGDRKRREIEKKFMEMWGNRHGQQTAETP